MTATTHNSLVTVLVYITGVIILGYIIAAILSRLLIHIVEVFLGFSILISILIFYIYKYPDRSKKYQPPRLRAFKFTDPRIWEDDVQFITNQAPEPFTLFPESFLLSESIDTLIEYIMRDFVVSWYSRAFKDDYFPAHVENAIRVSINRLGQRAKTIEWADVLVKQVLPTVTDHVRNYINAVTIVQQRSTDRQLVESKELETAIAERYGKLHDAITLSNSGYETHRRNWLRQRVLAFLPLLLDDSEMGSPIVAGLIKDILACSIMKPILSMLSSADFLNQMLVKSASRTLQDRQKVEKLRKALDEQSSTSLRNPTWRRSLGHGSSKRTSSSRMLKLSPHADQGTYDRFIRTIKKCESLPDARQIRFYISVQLQRLETGSHANKTYEERLKYAKRVIDQRIDQLSDKDISQPRSKDRDMEGASEQEFTDTTHLRDPRNDYTLADILDDAICSSFLMEYMDQRRRTVLVQFLLAVNILRDPLDRTYEAHQEGIDPLGGFLVADEEKSVKDNDMVYKQDILDIYSQYYAHGRNIIGYTEEEFEAVKEFVDSEKQPTKEMYHRARAAILSTQSSVYKSIVQDDLEKFKKSDLFLQFMVSVKYVPKSLSGNSAGTFSNVDKLQTDSIDEIEQEEEAFADSELGNSGLLQPSKLDRENDSNVDENPLLAVEKALNDIMNAPQQTTKVNDNDIEKILKDEKEIMPQQRKYASSTSSKSTHHRQTRLFDDEDDNEDANSAADSDLDLNNSIDSIDKEVRMAAPGDLSLTEAIKVLSRDISRLYDQESLVDTMITKAELTNNTAELRILNKSKASLVREIQLKELQRQQYIVQESDNSLYRRSDIHVQSYVTSMDATGPYTLYIIEVRKFGQDGDVNAGWIVGRRYNQFYQLHQHLKREFPPVGKLAFPKKRIALKFQPKTFVDARRIALEKYLQDLLAMEDVCRSKAFRLFLSSDTFSLDSLQGPRGGLQDMDSDSSSTSASTLSRSIPRMNNTPSNSNSMSTTSDLEVIPIVNTENDEFGGIKPFVQPMCDLFVEVFGLNTKENWLKGRAIVVILQQLLGGTIEKKVRDVISGLTDESKILDYVQLVRDSVWPNGERKQGPSPERTEKEKMATRKDAMLLLYQLLESPGKVIGRSSSRYAAKNLFNMCQNEILNTHLVYSIVDILFDELFPELKKSSRN